MLTLTGNGYVLPTDRFRFRRDEETNVLSYVRTIVLHTQYRGYNYHIGTTLLHPKVVIITATVSITAKLEISYQTGLWLCHPVIVEEKPVTAHSPQLKVDKIVYISRLNAFFVVLISSIHN